MAAIDCRSLLVSVIGLTDRGDRMVTAKLYRKDLFFARLGRTKNMPAISVLYFERIASALLPVRLNF
jgi:hypothetical protein